MPESYAPPVQRKPALSEDAPVTSGGILRMDQVETDAYILRDIPKGDTGPWRWTGARPTIRLYLTTIADYRARVEYTVAEATFKTTGPVTLRFFVNDQLLSEQRHDRPGNFTFEKPIPHKMLKANNDNDLAVEVDKPYVAERDGAKLGFILTAIGFVR